jgi:hypothetical protein
VASNLIRNNSIVYGGGSTEIACSIAVEAAADRYPEVKHVCILLTHNLIYNGVVLAYNHYDTKLLVLANRYF